VVAGEQESPPEREGVKKLLEVGAVYYRRFHFLDGAVVDESTPIYTGGARRISNTTTFFSLACAMMEVSNLVGYESKNADLATRAADSLFRGGRDDIDACIAAMSDANLVTRDSKLINIRSRAQCTFTQAYVDQIQEYSADIQGVVLGHRNLPARWRAVSHAFFDFMRYKYLPEWYLLLRRTLRTSRLTESMKDDINDDLFSSAGTWFAINQYILAYTAKSGTKIAPEQFRTILMAKLRIDS